MFQQTNIFQSLLKAIEDVTQSDEANLLARLIKGSEIPEELLSSFIKAWRQMNRAHPWLTANDEDFEGVISDLEARQNANKLVDNLSSCIEDFFSTEWITEQIFLEAGERYTYVWQICAETREGFAQRFDNELVRAVEEELRGSGLSFGMAFDDEFFARLPRPV
jgi:hypothetical protein